jgi:glycoprotein endo-alpha-1,2-mannosidase
MHLRYRYFSFLLILLFIFGTSCETSEENSKIVQTVNDNVFGFYYNWYGNTEFDGQEIHWAHHVIPQNNNESSKEFIPGKENLSSNFYPQLKNYSSNDPAIISKHMEMFAMSGIGVVAVTWWGDHYQGSESLPVLFDEAQKNRLKVCFHIEPYNGRSAQSVRENIGDFIEKFGQHPAFYRLNGKPLFFIYDSYLTPANEWAELLKSDGSTTIRNTDLDSEIIGLWVGKGEEDYFLQSGMDGFYTYFASTGFTYGSTPSNWSYMQTWASDHDLKFIPCVGPGYIDTRVRPWNGVNTREREDGKYYDRMFDAAIKSGAQFIGITSFNEWHEGTQIEPAIPFEIPEFEYLDYNSLEPTYYLERTAYWINRFGK